MNNKMIKGSVAGATGIVLLMGGFGTYALWSDSADLGASTVTSGELNITPVEDTAWSGTGDWAEGDPIVPGDVITRVETFTITGTGTNLEGTLAFTEVSNTTEFANSTPTESEPTNWMTVDVDIEVVDGDDIASTTVMETATDSNQFTFDSPFNTLTVRATAVYTFDPNTTGVEAQLADAALTGSGFVISQTDPNS